MWVMLLALVLLQFLGDVKAQPDACDGNACTAGTHFCCSLLDATACAQCCNDVHCTGNEVCDPATETCVGCVTNAHCAGVTGNPSCDGALKMCVPACVPGTCLTNEICNIALGQCVCATDGDLCDGLNEQCDANGNCGCIAGFIRDTAGNCISECSPVCTANRVCSRGGMCICGPGTVENALGNCLPCTADCAPACRIDQVCSNGVCICAPGTVDVLGDCIPCTAGCTVDTDCKNAGEICNAHNQCVCTTGSKLFRGQCVPPGSLGGACLNGKCKSNSKRVRCNTATNMCECRGNCQETTVCLKKKFKDWF